VVEVPGHAVPCKAGRGLGPIFKHLVSRKTTRLLYLTIW
jgi:hypothetical protein